MHISQNDKISLVSGFFGDNSHNFRTFNDFEFNEFLSIKRFRAVAQCIKSRSKVQSKKSSKNVKIKYFCH